MSVKFSGLLFFILLYFTEVISYAQISYAGRPKKISFSAGNNIPFIYVNRLVEKSEIDKSADEMPFTKVDCFADNVEVYYSPYNSGIWDKSNSDINIWRVGFCSDGASSIGIIFNKFELLPGSKLFLYSPSQKEILGAYSFRNNKATNLLAITPINDDSVIIELHLQKDIENFGYLEISQIGLGHPLDNKFKSTDDIYFGRSDWCQTDVMCYKEPKAQLQKHSACRVIYNSSARCTGTLINNTKRDGRPFVLTAGHCIKSKSSASTALFYFDYESPYCDGPDGKIKSLSGSKLIAYNESLDFTLVELSDNIPVDYHPVYSGWDISTNNFTGSKTFHHPWGDVKKISVNNDLVTDGSEYNFPRDIYWCVRNYEIGYTEKGSSGSAIFDSAYHIRGTLTSGDTGCTSDIYDVYSRFDRSWNFYPDNLSQLKHWLDPLNISPTYLDNYIPSDPLLQYSEQLSNITKDDNLIIKELKSGWGYPSGLNSSGITGYAEYFYRNGSKYIYAIKAYIAKVSTKSINPKVVFKIWDDNNLPHKEIFQKEIHLFELAENDTNLIRLDTVIRVDKDFFIGYEMKDFSTSDTFALFYSDPSLKTTENTAFAQKDGNWGLLSDGTGNVNTSLAIYPLLFDYYIDGKSTPGKFPFGEITIYPNPADDHIQVLFKKPPEGDINYRVLGVCGKEIISGSNTDIEPNLSINTSSLSPGVYIIQVYNLYWSFNEKFIKM